MKESSKERLATLLMDELLERLSTRESLRKMFGEMTSLPIDEVIEHLLVDFERSVMEYHQRLVASPKPATNERPSQPTPETAKEGVNPPINDAPTLATQQKTLQPPPTKETVLEGSTGANHATVVADRSEDNPLKLKAVASQSSNSQAIESPKESSETERHRVDAKADKPARDVTEDGKPEPAKQDSVQFDPIKLEFPKIRLKADIPIPSKPQDPVEPPAIAPPAKKEPAPSEIAPEQQRDLRRLQELALKIESGYAAKREPLPANPPVQEEQPKNEAPVIPFDTLLSVPKTSEDDEEIDSVGLAGSSKHTTRASYAFADDEFVYVHAVGRSPSDETSLPITFMLEEKGIDGHGFAFAFDYNGLRFYLSKVNPNEMNVSKAMVLLLNKQESLQLQGVHESTLNDLRGHGILLPFEFGTVARGKDTLLGLIDKNLEDLEEALDDVENTTWWTVTASVLDATIARIVGTDVQSIGRDRSRDRASYTSAPQGKKFDIKVLERILQREKKLAESVHTALSESAERADVDTMVGLGSGSSEDWKVILKASYDVPKRDIAKFSRAVTDLQYHHLQYDLMLALTGNRDCFVLNRK